MQEELIPPMVVAWSVRPLDYHSTILIGDEPAGDVSPQLAQLLADRHNANKRAHRTPAPLPAPQRPTAYE